MAEEAKKNSLVLNFLYLLSKWEYNVPLTTQWAITISPEAGNNLFSIINDYTKVDLNSFYIPTNLQEKLLNEKVQPRFDGLGLYFAQSVTLPSESFNFNSAGSEGMGGYMKGIIGGDRLETSNKTLKIDFLETNLDFVSGLIRPWIITASYKGLINLGSENSIKCSISVVEYTNSNIDQEKPVRKIHKLTGCVPTGVSEKTLKYDTEEIRINSINWLVEKYSYELVAE